MIITNQIRNQLVFSCSGPVMFMYARVPGTSSGGVNRFGRLREEGTRFYNIMLEVFFFPSEMEIPRWLFCCCFHQFSWLIYFRKSDWNEWYENQSNISHVNKCKSNYSVPNAPIMIKRSHNSCSSTHILLTFIGGLRKAARSGEEEAIFVLCFKFILEFFGVSRFLQQTSVSVELCWKAARVIPQSKLLLTTPGNKHWGNFGHSLKIFTSGWTHFCCQRDSKLALL